MAGVKKAGVTVVLLTPELEQAYLAANPHTPTVYMTVEEAQTNEEAKEQAFKESLAGCLGGELGCVVATAQNLTNIKYLLLGYVGCGISSYICTITYDHYKEWRKSEDELEEELKKHPPPITDVTSGEPASKSGGGDTRSKTLAQLCKQVKCVDPAKRSPVVTWTEGPGAQP